MNTNRSAMLSTMMKPPGVWIIIIGMLRAPTSFVRYVCTSCGPYCRAARNPELRPRKVAHKESCGERTVPEGSEGEADMKRNETMAMKILHDGQSSEK